MAVSCIVPPLAIEGFAGVTAIDVNIAAVTVTEVEPVTPGNPGRTALIVTPPIPVPVTKPSLPVALLTMASVVSEEPQVTDLVTSSVVPSENVPVAISCSPVPTGIDVLAGVTVSDVSTAAVTVTAAEPDTPASVAVIVELPTPVPVTSPLPLTVAMAADDEVQLT